MIDTDEARVREAAETLIADHPPASTDPVTFLGAQFDAGLGWVAYPEGHGGLGLAPSLQRTIDDRLKAAGGRRRRP